MKNEERFSKDSILMSGSSEQRVIVALSMMDASLIRGVLEQMLSAYLNWPWIIMQSMHHRTISMQWETLKRIDLVRLASKSGLSKNWIAYSEQLSRASYKRNELWLSQVELIFDQFAKSGIESVVIKGAALIGDLYSPQERMLGDVDTLIRQSDKKLVRDVLTDFGFKQGVINPVSANATSTIVGPIPKTAPLINTSIDRTPRSITRIKEPVCLE